MITQGDLVAAGVSGGADSVCLLHLLLRLRREISFRLIVVHVNHLARAEAAEDAAYVKALCGQLGVPYFLREVDMKGYAAVHRLSVEEAGRILRYRAFEEVLAEQGEGNAGCKIAVAHNANDRAETMLFHIFRGSGVKGVGSIQPVRGTVIHPLLCLEREEIEAYLESYKLAWRTDATNQEDLYTRNKIRRHILPYAEQEICQGAVAHMNGLADILSDTEAYLEEQSRKVYEACVQSRNNGETLWRRGYEPQAGADQLRIQADRLLAEHPVMVQRVLLSCLEQMIPHRKDITGRHIAELTELMTKEGSKELSLPCGVKAYQEYAVLFLVRKDRGFGAPFRVSGRKDNNGAVYEIKPPMELHIPGTGDVAFTLREPDPDLLERIFCKEEENIPENGYTKWFDYDKITTVLLLRTRRQGDYLTIDSSLRTKSVKQYMINEKVPKMQRDSLYLLADGAHVLWIPGYRISQYYKVDKSTKRILQVGIRGGRNGGTS